MKLKKIDLPGKYQNKAGNYPQFKGWNKFSYSQNSSFSDDKYRGQYIMEKFLGIRLDSGIFAFFGSAAGDYLNIQDRRIDEYLSEEDKKIIDSVELPKNTQYEFEIIINMEPFGLEKTCIQGFSDAQWETEPKKTNVWDAKTLNMDKKKEFYESDDYFQTDMYAYGLEELGYEIGGTGVIALGRKGNSLEPGAKHPLRLSGDVQMIERVYDRKKTIKKLKGMADNMVKVSDYYKAHKRYFK